jgi:hypothetical protein
MENIGYLTLLFPECLAFFGSASWRKRIDREGHFSTGYPVSQRPKLNLQALSRGGDAAP